MRSKSQILSKLRADGHITDEEYKMLEQEPCGDAISRQAVIDAMRKNHRSGERDIDGDYIEGDYREHLYDNIVSLPPVNPQPKTGHWIKTPNGFKCSKCLIVHPRTSIFCPSCGAKMIESQGRSEE